MEEGESSESTANGEAWFSNSLPASFKNLPVSSKNLAATSKNLPVSSKNLPETSKNMNVRTNGEGWFSNSLASSSKTFYASSSGANGGESEEDRTARKKRVMGIAIGRELLPNCASIGRQSSFSSAASNGGECFLGWSAHAPSTGFGVIIAAQVLARCLFRDDIFVDAARARVSPASTSVRRSAAALLCEENAAAELDLELFAPPGERHAGAESSPGLAGARSRFRDDALVNVAPPPASTSRRRSAAVLRREEKVRAESALTDSEDGTDSLICRSDLLLARARTGGRKERFKALFLWGLPLLCRSLVNWASKTFLGRGSASPPEWSWLSVLGQPILNDGDTCSIAACTVCIVGQHRLAFERKYKHGSFTFEAKHPDRLKNICQKRGVWSKEKGSWVSDVLNVIISTGGVPTKKVPNDIMLPLGSYVRYRQDGHLQDSSFVYQGVTDPETAEAHAVVCFAYRVVNSQLQIRIMDNQTEDGPLIWVMFGAFDRFFLPKVEAINPRLLRRKKRWRKGDQFEPLEYILSKLLFFL